MIILEIQFEIFCFLVSLSSQSRCTQKHRNLWQQSRQHRRKFILLWLFVDTKVFCYFANTHTHTRRMPTTSSSATLTWKHLILLNIFIVAKHTSIYSLFCLWMGGLPFRLFALLFHRQTLCISTKVESFTEKKKKQNMHAQNSI